MKSTLFVAGLALVVAGCQQSAMIRTGHGGPYQAVAGAQIELKRDIRVPAGKARVYLQADGRGNVVTGGFDSYRPHCAFEIDSVDHAGVDIHAETFIVTRIERTIVMVVDSAGIQVAALAWPVAGAFDGGSNNYYDGYHFWIASDRQPGVRRMTCYGVYAAPYELYPPTRQEINAALGDVAELRY